MDNNSPAFTNANPVLSLDNRIAWIDVVRSIAIISITLNHAVNRSFAPLSGQSQEFLELPILVSIIEAAFCAFSRIGVPLFLMITGALLLNRSYEEKGRISHFLKHNWLNLFIITEIWLAIMFCYWQLGPNSVLFVQGVKACLARFVMTLLFINPITMASMWYMEMILCVYLMIPVLAIGLKKIDWRYFIIPMIIVAFSSLFIPDVNAVLKGLNLSYELNSALTAGNVFPWYVICIILGYLLINNKIKIIANAKSSIIILMAILSFVGYLLFQLWFLSLDYNYVVGYKSIFPSLTAFFVFEVIHRFKPGKIIQKLTEKLSKISLGIYFVHICIMEGLVFIIKHFQLNIMHLSKLVFLETVSFFGSILIIVILSKSKYLKKYLFGIK